VLGKKEIEEIKRDKCPPTSEKKKEECEMRGKNG